MTNSSSSVLAAGRHDALPSARRFVYIAGMLRSGSTLLCRQLGSLPGALAIGELSGIWAAAARGEMCSCQTPIPECPIWGPALQAVESEHGVGRRELPAIAGLASQVLRTRRSNQLWRLRSSPPTGWPTDVREYVGLIDTLSRELLRVSKADTLIDSSKLPPGQLILSLLGDTRVDVVHLVRDPRAVAASERRQTAAPQFTENPPPTRSPLRSAMFWSGANMTCAWFGPTADSYRRISFEDLVSDTGTVLQAVAVSLNLQPPQLSQPEGALARGHVAVGNRSRFLPPDASIAKGHSSGELTAVQSLLVRVATAPVTLVMNHKPPGPSQVDYDRRMAKSSHLTTLRETGSGVHDPAATAQSATDRPRPRQ